MKILGIIAEFNPFHNGHKYLIEQAKRNAGADACIIVMSGNFVQRGEPAIMDKFTRAQIALKCGADIVIELPTFIATASAEGFAHGAVSLLKQLNIVDTIAFGIEKNSIDIAVKISELLIEESTELKNSIKLLCESGLSYPVARSKTVLSMLPDTIKPDAEKILSSPNSILAIEYLKAIKRLNWNIEPVTIKRKGAGYNDTSQYDNFSSASGIRNFLKEHKNISECVPEASYEIMIKYMNTRGFVYEEDIFSALIYKLMSMDKNKLSEYIDSNEFIANKIKNCLYEVFGYDKLIELLSSKDYTVSRIKRVLTHILLEIDKSFLSENSYIDYTAKYARILACNNDRLLSLMCQNSKIPVIVKVSAQTDSLDVTAVKHFNTDLNANNIYQGIIATKHKVTPLNELKQNIFPEKTKG